MPQYSINNNTKKQNMSKTQCQTQQQEVHPESPKSFRIKKTLDFGVSAQGQYLVSNQELKYILDCMRKLFPFAKIPDYKWATGRKIFKGNLEDITDEERDTMVLPFEMTNEDFLYDHYERNVCRATAPGPEKHTRRQPRWFETAEGPADSRFAAAFRDLRTWEYHVRLTDLKEKLYGEELRREMKILTDRYKNDPDFLPESLGITNPIDWMKAMAYGVKFVLTVTWHYIEGTECTTRVIDKSKPPTWEYEFSVPVYGADGVLNTKSGTRSYFDFEDMMLDLESGKLGLFKYDKYNPDFWGIPMFVNGTGVVNKKDEERKLKDSVFYFLEFNPKLDSRKAMEKAHYEDETIRVMRNMGEVTAEQRQAVFDVEERNYLRAVFFNYKFMVFYGKKVNGKKVGEEFEVRNLYKEYFRCQQALAKGQPKTTTGGLVWRFEKNGKGDTVAILDKTWNMAQKAIAKAEALYKEEQALAKDTDATKSIESLETELGLNVKLVGRKTEKVQVEKTTKEPEVKVPEVKVNPGSFFAGLSADVDLENIEVIEAKKVPKRKQKKQSVKAVKASMEWTAAAARGHEMNPTPVTIETKKKTVNKGLMRKIKRQEEKKKAIAEAKKRKMARTVCRNGEDCEHKKCGFLHPKGRKIDRDDDEEIEICMPIEPEVEDPVTEPPEEVEETVEESETEEEPEELNVERQELEAEKEALIAKQAAFEKMQAEFEARMKAMEESMAKAKEAQAKEVLRSIQERKESSGSFAMSWQDPLKVQPTKHILPTKSRRTRELEAAEAKASANKSTSSVDIARLSAPMRRRDGTMRLGR
jgi:hypothetical protein